MLQLLLTLVLFEDPGAKAVDVLGGGVVQVQAGRAPLRPDADPVGSVATTLTPNVELLYRDRARGGTFSLGYAPRVLYRWPNIAGLRRPLLLHQATMTYGARVSRLWDFAGRASASVGEVDYTAAQTVFGDSQGTLPSLEVIQYLQTRAGVVFEGRLSRRQTLGIIVDGGYAAPLGDDGVPDDMATLVPTLPRSYLGTLGISHAYDLTPVDVLTSSIGGTFIDFDARGAQTTESASVRWNRRITSRLESRVGLGAYAVQVVREPTTGLQPSDSVPVLPTADAGLNGRLYQRARVRLTGDAGASLQAYFDQVTGEVLPRAGGALGLTAFFPPSWTAGASVNFYTLATAQPRDFEGLSVDPSLTGDTVVSARTPVSYRIDERFAVEFGTIVSARAPHVRTADFAFRQLETWVYFAFRVQFSTMHAGGQSRGGGGSTVSGGAIQ